MNSAPADNLAWLEGVGLLVAYSRMMSIAIGQAVVVELIKHSNLKSSYEIGQFYNTFARVNYRNDKQLNG